MIVVQRSSFRTRTVRLVGVVGAALALALATLPAAPANAAPETEKHYYAFIVGMGLTGCTYTDIHLMNLYDYPVGLAHRSADNSVCTDLREDLISTDFVSFPNTFGYSTTALNVSAAGIQHWFPLNSKARICDYVDNMCSEFWYHE